MASPPFQLEDQTDEDFFDKLVDDDIDYTRSGPSFVDGNDSDEVKAFSNLSIGEVGSIGVDSGGNVDFGVDKGIGDTVVSASFDPSGNNFVANVSNSSTVSNVVGFGVDGEKGFGDGVVSAFDPPENKFVATDSTSSALSNIVGIGVDDEKGFGDVVVSASDSPENKLIANESTSSILNDGVGFGVDGEMDSRVGVVSVSDPPENNLVANESTSSTPGSVVEPSDIPVRTEGADDGTAGNQTSEAGVKVVDWSSFNSESHFNSGNGFGSYSDLFGEIGDNSGDPFAKLADTSNFEAEPSSTDVVSENHVADLSSLSSTQHQEGQYYEAGAAQSLDGQDLNSNQNWENLYPGWRYDPTTGQWHQLDGYVADPNTNVNVLEGSVVNALSATGVVPEQESNAYYLQQTAQSVEGSMVEAGSTGTVSNWNQPTQGTAEYPAHMVFDPQYPDWYYDTIAQEWRLLESYRTAVNQSTNVDSNQQNYSASGAFPENIYSNYDRSEQVENYQSHSQGFSSQDQVVDGAGSVNNYNQQNMTMWQPEPVSKSEATNFTDNQQFGNDYGLKGHQNNSMYQQTGFKPAGTNAVYGQTGRGFDSTNGVVGFQSFVPAENFLHHSNHSKMEASQQATFSSPYFDDKFSASFPQQPLQSATQFVHASSDGRSSAGRPPHALVTFGFGGKLIVMRDNSLFTNSTFGSQDSAGGMVNVFSLMEVITDKNDPSSIGLGARDYFHSLCQQSFPGPLTGGSVGSRELNKWIDDKIANSDYSDMDYKKGVISRMLLPLLKIACQYYGKLRSPFGSDQAAKDSDCPESAIAKLFASTRRDGVSLNEFGTLTHCLQNLPSEAQIQATALEVQKLLVSGRKKEALEYAQEGQLWGPALVLASQLGDQLYGDTVKQMALQQLVAGSPLRTLCLLIAGQPKDVFSDPTASSNMSSSVYTPQQPVQIGSNCMLEEWEENLAIITANRTKDDELVIVHLGDCLWKERDNVTAAHICYLLAEKIFESYSDSARLCLIGADHWKFPRTYASPEAIQRTELYEYAKVLGNPQFILLPFQPYKFIYALMLAEVGKLSDSLKYCQAILKSLKTGRAPEMDTWKQLVSSLEERIRTHQQGGYSTNLAPTKLVGKLLNFFDSTAHRVVGGLPPPIPSSSHSSVQRNGSVHQQVGPRVSNSQSTMAMSTLMPSASMEPISDWTGGGNRTAMPNRSISEPDFGKTPRKVDSSDQVDSSKEANSSDTQNKASVSGGPSRFGRFGSQLLQKTVGLVLRSRPDRQAKLGEQNKFYYDEKLKRWVEEGAAPPAEEAALPPPPTTAAFQSGLLDQVGRNFPNEKVDTLGGPDITNPISSERSPGIPPIPPSSNQFSARGRMGVRARYVDTFNKGGGTPGNLFQSPSIPAAKSGVGSNPKFFVPPPAASSEETTQTTGENMQEAVVTNESPSTSFKEDFFSSPPTSAPPSMAMQRYPSMDNIVHKRMGAMGHSSLGPHSRRTASWSGSLSDANNPSGMAEVKSLGHPPSSFMPIASPSMRHSMSNNSSTEDLQEVKL